MQLEAEEDSAQDLVPIHLAHEQLAFHHAIQLYGSALEVMPEGDPRHTDITVRRAIAFSRLSHAVFEEGVRWERDAEQL